MSAILKSDFKNVGVATKRPRALIWRKTVILLSTMVHFFRKLLKVDSLTSNRYITVLKSIKYHLK